MKTFEEHMQEAVGATYPIDIILNNLETEDIVEEINNYAKEVAKEALKNASVNAEVVCELANIYDPYSTYFEVDKQSILNESNIPKL